MPGNRVAVFAFLLPYALFASAQSCPGISDADRTAPFGGISAPAGACFYKNITGDECLRLARQYSGTPALPTRACGSDVTKTEIVFYNRCEWPRGACGFFPNQSQAGTTTPPPQREEQPAPPTSAPKCEDGWIPAPISRGTCMPAGADDCGNGRHCRAGNVCAKGGGCIPAGTTQCGSGYCTSDKVCTNQGECLAKTSERMCSNGKSYCKAGYACTGGNECRPVAQARENCTAEARAEAKINIDWELLHDAPARHTFETARSSGKDVFNSLLDAQGHNPEAQASIRRCKDWSISYASSLLAREEQDPDAELQTGIALFDRKDFVAAISHFEIALRAFRAKNNPAAAEVENYLARARAALQGSQYGQGGRMSVGTRQEETGGLPGPIRVILSGGYEVPPVSTLAGGSGTFSVAADGTITGSIVTGGMRGTTAHIHRGAKGQNGPVIIALTKRGDTYSVPDGRRLTPEQVQDLKAGKLYVNVHSDRYKGGELRAQLQP